MKNKKLLLGLLITLVLPISYLFVTLMTFLLLSLLCRTGICFDLDIRKIGLVVRFVAVFIKTL